MDRCMAQENYPTAKHQLLPEFATIILRPIPYRWGHDFVMNQFGYKAGECFRLKRELQ